MELKTILSQNDPRWSGKQLGDCTDTIGQSGCFDTVSAMVLSDFGYTVTPDLLSDNFKADGIYQQGCLLPDDGLCRVHQSPGDLQIGEQGFYYGDQAADLGKLGAPDGETQVVVQIHTAAVESHFMRVAAAWPGADGRDPDAGSILVDDPWDGVRKKFQDSFGGSDPGGSIVKILWYTAHPSVVSAPPTPAAAPAAAPASSPDPAPSPAPTPGDPTPVAPAAADPAPASAPAAAEDVQRFNLASSLEDYFLETGGARMAIPAGEVEIVKRTEVGNKAYLQTAEGAAADRPFGFLEWQLLANATPVLDQVEEPAPPEPVTDPAIALEEAARRYVAVRGTPDGSVNGVEPDAYAQLYSAVQAL